MTNLVHRVLTIAVKGIEESPNGFARNPSLREAIMQKYQVFIYRDGHLIWISQVHNQPQARALAGNWKKLGYWAEIRPVEGRGSVRICEAEPSDELVHSRRLVAIEAVERLGA